jgi:hypothetical protein
MVTYLHNYVVLEQVTPHQLDFILPHASALLVLRGFEIVAPFKVMSVTPTHLIPSFALERYVV